MPQIPEYKRAQLEYKHVGHRPLSPLRSPDGTDKPPAVKTTESILSAATTGWLSHLSDRFGRKKILVLSMFGALFMFVEHLLLCGSADLALGTSFISLSRIHPRCSGDTGRHSSSLHRL